MTTKRKPHKDWKSWDRAWGWTLELYGGIEITVQHGMTKGSHFSYSGLGRRSKNEYEDEKEAMIRAEDMARRVLSIATEKLADNA